ncbi:outer membrane protein transport protein [uncultured Jannaschia sp.]|uniref:OmpP1/FadL family transporter n=1 Tax=uncultured Jannaschia sp. TaxID=293347 RepID=UPI0026049EC8|nr:outer membrane protein transport protein [uncultured Jannaschia sp.]
MNRFALAAITAMTGTVSAEAGGLDRSMQNIIALFDPSNTLSFSLTHVNPDLPAEDIGGTGTYSVAGSYTDYQFSYANRINERVSFAIIGDQPFGSDIFYNAEPGASNIGGTRADIESDALSFLGRYEFTDRMSVFGGLRAQRVDARISLNGQAYANALALGGVAAGAGVDATTLAAAITSGPNQVAAITALGGGDFARGQAAAAELGGQVQSVATGFVAQGGYDLDLEDDWALGYTLGAAYEIPEIALRLAVTYHSEVTHDNGAREILPLPGFGTFDNEVNFASPQSVNIDFQTGLNARTLLLAGLRWTDWDDFSVIPKELGVNLAEIEDSYRWTVGVARRFTDAFVGLASITYEEDQGLDTVSPLGPYDGQIGLSLGARYTRDRFNLSGGVNYTWVGSADAGVAGQPVTAFRDSSALGVGLNVDYRF